MATLIKTHTAGVGVTDITAYTAATVSASNAKELFEAEVSAADGRWFFEVDNTSNSSDVFVYLPGKTKNEVFRPQPATVKAGTKAIVFADSSDCTAGGGKLQIELGPSSGKNLAAGGVKLHAIQFIPAECR